MVGLFSKMLNRGNGLFSKMLNRENGKFICPFCFCEYDKGSIKYVCPNCGEISYPTTSAEKGKPKLPCKHCGKTASVKLCPHCGEYDYQQIKSAKDLENTKGIIPSSALDVYDNLPFCVVGVSSSGKTNFITIMLEELRKSKEPRLTLAPQDIPTREIQKTLYKQIYEKHEAPDHTRTVEEGNGLRPQLWQIKNRMRESVSDSPTYGFTIYDGAGEDYEERLDPASAVCGYINASNAIIITLDPLILTNLRKLINPAVMMNSNASRGGTNSAEDIVNGLANYIKTACGINTSKKLAIPVALVLTKFDVIMQLDSLSKNAVVRQTSNVFSNGKVNMTEISQVDEEIREWLYEIGEGSFIDALESNFKKFYFFGVSSYGGTPKEQGFTTEEIKPHRILDPVLWLFREAKFID